LRELIEQAECELPFLPPYSPNFNQIEKFWVRLKQYFGQTLAQFDCLQDAVDDAFRKLS
jgi:transposase